MLDITRNNITRYAAKRCRFVSTHYGNYSVCMVRRKPYLYGADYDLCRSRETLRVTLAMVISATDQI